ncbi:hypothetical protein ACFSKN_15540 [Mariniflexile gromovii]|uniref:Lipoprotein n=1 Tax=Mariniflexile gromovii TaxID=362523 RepID=A0ABS4BWW1_9FLAO|nr:hypothetical protein [Mariniflexile gromovii]MBP0905072.1 hypothetical protein [Mariniflexile gromovii]
MKKLLKNYGIIILTLVMLQSCKKDDLYYNLSDDAKGFLFFNLEDTFKLKNLTSDEIITLTVVSKEFNYFKDGPNESFSISFGVVPADVYVEIGVLKFTDTTNCYNGEIFIMANQDGSFVLRVSLNECFMVSSYYQYYDELLPTTSVEGIEYQNAYILKGGPNDLFYSKEKGILKITDFEENIIFGVIE